MYTEFRVKWPRGELGALPDDAKQDLKIEYLQKDVENFKRLMEDIEEDIDELKIKESDKI